MTNTFKFSKIAVMGTVAAQKALHMELGKQSAELGVRIHEAACQDLLHCYIHGDTSLCQDLYVRLGGGTEAGSPARTASLKAWFVEMSGNQMTADKGQWKMKKGWSKDKFDLAKAEVTPYYVEPEKEAKKISWYTFFKLLQGFEGKVDKADAEGNFNGNAAAVKTILADIVDLAEKRAARLTAQDKGKVLNQADAILKTNTVVPAAISAAMQEDAGITVEQVAGDTITSPEAEVVAA